MNQEALLRLHMGDASEAEREHVAMCKECQAQAKPLDDALSWFGAAARQWGEEKAAVAEEAKAAAAMEWQESKSAAARNWRGMIGVWATVSVALLLILSIGLPRWNAHRAALEAQAHQQQLLQREKQDKQELARDNALLDQVDQDVSQVVPQAMQPLSWSPASSGSASASGGTASRQ
ncbi:MAG: hypothetical protein ACJ71S_05240 [Acidobacteriaceae bacterium]